jgi:hypothetical protein
MTPSVERHTLAPRAGGGPEDAIEACRARQRELSSMIAERETAVSG